MLWVFLVNGQLNFILYNKSIYTIMSVNVFIIYILSDETITAIWRDIFQFIAESIFFILKLPNLNFKNAFRYKIGFSMRKHCLIHNNHGIKEKLAKYFPLFTIEVKLIFISKVIFLLFVIYLYVYAFTYFLMKL